MIRKTTRTFWVYKSNLQKPKFSIKHNKESLEEVLSLQKIRYYNINKLKQITTISLLATKQLPIFRFHSLPSPAKQKRHEQTFSPVFRNSSKYVNKEFHIIS